MQLDVTPPPTNNVTTSVPQRRLKLVRTWGKTFKTFVANEIGWATVIAIFSVIILTIILASRYWFLENPLYSHFSTHTIYAQKTFKVEDSEETDRLRYEAKQLVEPIYVRNDNIRRLVMNQLVDALEDIEAVQRQTDLSEQQKTRQIEQILNRKAPIRGSLMLVLLNNQRWPVLYDAAVETTQKMLQQSISSDVMGAKRNLLVHQALPLSSKLTVAEKEAVALLVRTYIQPTLVIDRRSTEEARELAASHVKPVEYVFRKGDLIVKKGDPITGVQERALKAQGSIAGENPWLAVLGVAILTTMLMAIVWGYLYRFEHHTFYKPSYCGLIATTIILAVGTLAALIDIDPSFAVEIYPVGIMSLMICLFTHPRIAILSTLIVILLCGLTLKIPLETLSVLMISSMIGIIVLSRKPVPKDRNDMILAGLAIGLCRALIILALSFVYESSLSVENLGFLARAGLGVMSGLLTGIITLGALPLFESWFKLVTPYTLLELGNHDRPILRRMQMEAPGTFHHSVMVASLAEAAAEAISANPILARVGSLYHDIGKVKRPLFFVENQAYFGVENPHGKLTPRLSKMVIVAHPRDGVEMGRQLGLPKAILRFMPEHHGTLIAGYFYNKAVLQEGEENVNKNQFRYPGPKPQSKETAIVMLADASESSVRALKNPSTQQVEERVDKIIQQRIEDGQFSECPITMHEIQVVRDTFVRILRGIQHNRIEYQQTMLAELSQKTVLELPRPEELKAQLQAQTQAVQATASALVGVNAMPPSPDELRQAEQVMSSAELKQLEEDSSRQDFCL